MPDVKIYTLKITQNTLIFFFRHALALLQAPPRARFTSIFPFVPFKWWTESMIHLSLSTCPFKWWAESMIHLNLSACPLNWWASSHPMSLEWMRIPAAIWLTDLLIDEHFWSDAWNELRTTHGGNTRVHYPNLAQERTGAEGSDIFYYFHPPICVQWI